MSMNNTKERVFDLFSQGVKPSQIARSLNVSRQRVSQILNREDSTGHAAVIRMMVKDRDGWKCQWGLKCKGRSKGVKLVVHHLDKNRANNKPDNLITLCEQCHIRFHNLDRGTLDESTEFKKIKAHFKK